MTGFFRLVESGSLSAHGRLSQCAQISILFFALGLKRAMMFVDFNRVPSYPFRSVFCSWTSQPNCLNFSAIHFPHASCAVEFIVRGPKRHCAAVKAYAESALN